MTTEDISTITQCAVDITRTISCTFLFIYITKIILKFIEHSKKTKEAQQILAQCNSCKSYDKKHITQKTVYKERLFMRDFLKNNRWIVGIVIFIIVFPAIILYASKKDFIPKDIGIAIIGYVGAIIGGFLTLYGVWWTIEDNNKNRKKDLELQYCPILSANIINIPENTSHLSNEIIILFKNCFFNDDDLLYSNQLIELCNVGRGEIQDCEISIENIETIAINSNQLLELNTDNSYISPIGALEFIPINGKAYLYVSVPTPKNTIENFYIRIGVTLNISIDGAFSSKKENYLLKFYFEYENPKNLTIDSLKLIRDKNQQYKNSEKQG